MCNIEHFGLWVTIALVPSFITHSVWRNTTSLRLNLSGRQRINGVLVLAVFYSILALLGGSFTKALSNRVSSLEITPADACVLLGLLFLLPWVLGKLAGRCLKRARGIGIMSALGILPADSRTAWEVIQAEGDGQPMVVYFKEGGKTFRGSKISASSDCTQIWLQEVEEKGEKLDDWVALPKHLYTGVLLFPQSNYEALWFCETDKNGEPRVPDVRPNPASHESL